MRTICIELDEQTLLENNCVVEPLPCLSELNDELKLNCDL